MPSKRTSPERVHAILSGLREAYPDAECALVHGSAWELLVATILSAQCTDVRVNMVTPALFRKYPRVGDMAALAPEALEPDIRSTGFYRNKAKSITGAARRLVDVYHGEVPASMEDLLTLPGVARKTANVVLGVWFHQASGIVVDTHVQRVSRRLELTRNEAPEKIEQDLQKLIPRDEWIAFSHRVIAHGRQLCVARKPRCATCPI
ncbi:MAG: endonuclease III, partial [Terriglobales bacterium]